LPTPEFILTPRETIPQLRFDGNPFFVKCPRFQGAQNDYVFKIGDCGLGYYNEFKNGFLDKLRSSCDGLPGRKKVKEKAKKIEEKPRRSSISEGGLFTTKTDKLVNSQQADDAFADYKRAKASKIQEKYTRRSSTDRGVLEVHLRNTFTTTSQLLRYCKKSKVSCSHQKQMFIHFETTLPPAESQERQKAANTLQTLMRQHRIIWAYKKMKRLAVIIQAKFRMRSAYRRVRRMHLRRASSVERWDTLKSKVAQMLIMTHGPHSVNGEGGEGGAAAEHSPGAKPIEDRTGASKVGADGKRADGKGADGKGADGKGTFENPRPTLRRGSVSVAAKKGGGGGGGGRGGGRGGGGTRRLSVTHVPRELVFSGNYPVRGRVAHLCAYEMKTAGVESLI
jgi:hypothetical protein